ncbi:MAG: 5-formyltetrahydrofolate cyclo-ligase [Stenotrophobium sp.]
MRQRRKSISSRDGRHAANAAARHFLRSGWLRRARHVALYLNHGSELGTAPLISLLRNLGIRVYAPKIGRDHSMRFLDLRIGTQLRRNLYGIAEPAGHRNARGIRRMDLVILPLLGFDAGGRRLGMGGGYYDRALSFARAFRRPRLIGYAYAAQEVSAIPAQAWDIHLDGVVTERGARSFDRSTAWPTG